MKVDINNILHAVGDHETVSFEETLPDNFDDEARFLGPVSVSATLTNSGIGIIVAGDIEAVVELTCGVCLKKFETALSVPFEERFVEEGAHQDEGLKEEQELKGEDIYYTYHEYEIDLADMLRELLILSLPIAPKCDINCSVKKDKEEKTIDPRLAILARLKGGG